MDALIAEPEGARTQAAPLALYRRYRPDTFADLIGQDHVTAPLQRALTNNKVNHAYLFSGPRGCGKTTSARILARALNCEQGPTPTPCGECQSCRDLARGGPGSIDVIEIDAASHGGVDDARDLRDRAFFAPVSSRYKVYIIDEAHMVTAAGFNALLKLVEEPPPHVKFVFATTEPEKVIGTIRSRTHHYPFRLVPPKVLGAYLAELCEAEGVAVEESVLPLVVRAGAGSVRDSLSVLDQLLGGAADDGVSYTQAAALLGYTPDSLLDEVLDAVAAGDAGGVFSAVDKVIEVGQDPRRFAEDLLRRLRDLVIVAAVPDAVSSGLVDVAGDQAERLQNQAASLGAGELTRAAEVIAAGLTEMRGTTAPRLHLELMCSRVLLPEADLDGRGLHARIDRLERVVGMNAGAPLPQTAPVPAPTTSPEPVRPTSPEPVRSTSPEPVERSEPVRPTSPEPVEGSASSLEPVEGSAPVRPTSAEPVRSTPPEPVEGPAATSPAPTQPAAESATTGMGTADVRRLWPDVLEAVKRRRRYTWILLSQNSHVMEAGDGRLTLGLANPGARDAFSKGGSEEILTDALAEVLGTRFAVQAIVDPGDGPSRGGGSSGPGPAPSSPPPQPTPAATPPPVASAPTSAPTNAPTAPPMDDGPQPGPAPERPEANGAQRETRPDPTAVGAISQQSPVAAPSSPTSPEAQAAAVRARESIRATRHAGGAVPPPEDDEPEPDVDQWVDRDDEVMDDSFGSHTELLARHLDAEIIEDEEVG